jgi:hypothetical protein
MEERLVRDPEPATRPGGPVHSARLRVGVRGGCITPCCGAFLLGGSWPATRSARRSTAAG